MSGARYGELLDALRGVAWPAKRSVRGAPGGTHRARVRGVSPEFTEYRPYRQGDDPRRLDWKLLARTDRAYLRITNDRATFGTLIVVDGSASMAFPKPGLDKWSTACALAVGLGAVSNAAGDAVALRIAAPGARVLEPRTRRGLVSEIARTLDEIRPSGSLPLTPLLAAARNTPRVAIISDFLGDADEMVRASAELVASGGEVHAIHVVAVKEIDPGRTVAMVTDPENPELRRPLAPESRTEYDVAFSAWREELAWRWRSIGAGYTFVRTDEPVQEAVRRVARSAEAERLARA